MHKHNFNLLIFCAGSFSKEFETDSDEICQLVNNSCLQTCLKKGNFYLSRPRHSVLIESEFLPVTNLTLSLLSVSPDTFVRQRMKWNFNDHLSKKSLYRCLTGSLTSTRWWRPSCCSRTRLRGCRGWTSGLLTRPPGPPSSGPSSSYAKQGGKKYHYCNFDFTKNFRSKGEVTLEPPIYANFVSTFEYIESCNRTILNYGWVEFPLAYTQVYFHFLIANGQGQKKPRTVATLRHWKHTHFWLRQEP